MLDHRGDPQAGKTASDGKSRVAGLTVLQVIPWLGSGGAERSTLEITAALREAGARALVAAEGGRLVPEITALGGHLIPLRLRTKNPIRMIRNGVILARIVDREGVSILHVRSRGPAWSAVIAAWLTGVPLVTTYHGLYRAQGALKRWYNGVMARGTRVIANSDFTARHVAVTYPKARSRLVTIPRGVDLALFNRARLVPSAAAELRRAWGLAADTRLILVPGRLTAWKGQTIVIEALGHLNAQGRLQNVRAVLIGDTQSESYRDGLEAQTRSLGLEGIVRIVGHVADMPLAYGIADIVVQASTAPEGFGRVAAEAQAMGAIVVASAIGAAAETVRTGPGGTGFLVPPGDAGALAEVLAHALALTPDARAAMARRARAHITQNFALTRMCADTLALYAALSGKLQ